jgi:predicted signal transduction protein with EAL and GGDEF domain
VRLGGDEFAIVVGRARTQQEVAAVALQVLRQTDAPITYAGKAIHFGLSIGCVVFPQDAEGITDLMKRADMALNELKARSRGGVRMFDKRLLAIAEDATTQLKRAARIVRDGSVRAFYRPVIGLADGQVAGLDAALRWHQPGVRGLRPASEIMEAFNHYEPAVGIADLMQERVFSDIARWLEQGFDPLPVSIRVALVEFLQNDFAERLLEKMGRFRIPKQWIGINVSERVLVERGMAYATRALRLLRDEGVRIALDDFGTGRSSFVRVPEYPIDCLKMDRSLVERMGAEPSMRAIVETTAKLGSSLSIDVVAKGIETAAQVRLVKDAGCVMGQGPFFGAKLDGDAAAALLGSRRRTAKETAPRRRKAATGG